MNKLKIAKLLSLLLLLSACFKKETDLPPDHSGYDPGLTVTHSIAQLQDMPQGIPITTDIVVSGIVVMNDRNGNLFNKIIIQDHTGGIAICIDQSYLDKSYPTGRKIYVKCKGLVCGNDNENLQLGTGTDEQGRAIPIPGSVVDDYVVKANYPNALPADTVSLSTLSSLYTGGPYLNKRVVIRQAEFLRDDIGMPYAQSADIATATMRTLQDCTGAQLRLQTSAYASFRATPVPAGRGFISGIFIRNRNIPQLLICDTGDVQCYSTRCDGTLPDAAGLTSVAGIRNLITETTDSISDMPAYRIAGVVISDKNAGNTEPSYLVLQQGAHGLTIHFTEIHSFEAGDSVVIDLHHTTLARTHNRLQIANLHVERASKVAAGRIILPRTATIAELVGHYSDWESTLVRIPSATVTSTGTYSGSKALSDTSGMMTLYTRSSAAFAGAWPSYGVHSYTGILSAFNEAIQLQLRNLGDVQ